MHLFTIMDSMRKKKFLISGDTINNIIIKASEKKNLPSLEYKLVREQNGAVMDEVEFLSVLPVLTDILILEKEEEWQSREEIVIKNKSLTHTAEDSFNGESVEDRTPVRTEVLNVTAVYERRKPFSFPWNNLPDTMKEKLELGKTLSNKECRELRKILGIHMVGTLKHFKRTTVSSLVDIFVNKYPQALEIIDADREKLSNVRDAFVIRLYTVKNHLTKKLPEKEELIQLLISTKVILKITWKMLFIMSTSVLPNKVHCQMSQKGKRLELLEKRKIWLNLNKDKTTQK